MSNFKIGEKVVCVEPNGHLIKGEIYEIESIEYCCCENLVLKGLPFKLESKKSECTNCGHISNKNEKGSWRFRKLDHAFGEKICAEILESIKAKQEQLN